MAIADDVMNFELIIGVTALKAIGAAERNGETTPVQIAFSKPCRLSALGLVGPGLRDSPLTLDSTLKPSILSR